MRVTLSLTLASLFLAGCQLLGISGTGCPTALLEGTLAPDPEGGALVVTEFGQQPVDWPDGYQAETVAGRVQLLDAGRNVVASEGESIYVGGGMDQDDTVFAACGYVGTQPP